MKRPNNNITALKIEASPSNYLEISLHSIWKKGLHLNIWVMHSAFFAALRDIIAR